jgi:hypothetical protein
MEMMRVVTEDTVDLDELLEQIMNDNPQFERLLGDDQSADPYGIPMVNLASILLTYHMAKDAGYGRSWARRGESGVFHNVMRKGDRMESLFKNIETLEKLAKVVMSEHESVSQVIRVARIDNLADLALYCMMWISYIMKTTPDDFTEWMRTRWSEATGIPMDDVESYLI